MLKRIGAVLVAVALVIFGWFWISGKEAELKFAHPVSAIGTVTPIVIQVDDPAGVKSFSASVEQAGQSQIVYEDKTKSRQKSRIYSFTAGKQQAAFLKEGAAKIVVKASTNDFRGATKTLSQQSVEVLTGVLALLTHECQLFMLK